MSDIEKPVEKPVEEAPAAGQTTTKSPTFLDKLSLFTIGKNRGQLPPEKGMWLQFLSVSWSVYCFCKNGGRILAREAGTCTPDK